MNFNELRRNPCDLSTRVTLLDGTEAPSLQICDHLLAQWQTSVRDGRSWSVPLRSVVVSANRVKQYYTVSQIIRGGVNAVGLARDCSLQRDAAGSQKLAFFGAYDGLLTVHEEQWNDQDHELIQLLLNEDEGNLLESKIRWLAFVA